MNVNGLTAGQALTVLTESNPGIWAGSISDANSAIDRLKDRNFTIAIVTAVVATAVSYFKSLMEFGRGFSFAYDLADELNSQVLKDICINHLAKQNKEYKIAVEACYGIVDMPEEVYELVK